MKTEYFAIGFWLLYSFLLFKFIMLDSWGTIAAGIGDMPIDGIKVGFLSFLPYLGITVLVWRWRMLNARGFALLGILTAFMVLIGFTAYFYLFRLHVQNDIVLINNTWLHFSVTSGVFMLLMMLLFMWQKFGKVADVE